MKAFASRKLGDNWTLRRRRTRLIFPVSGLGQRNGTRAPNLLLLCTPKGPTMSRLPSGRVLPLLNQIRRVAADGLADADFADICSSGKGQPSFLHAECGENLGPEE